MYHHGSSHINKSLRDGLLVGIANTRFKKWREVQIPKEVNVANHLVVKSAHHREVLDINWQQETIRFLQEDDNNILQYQIFNLILMVEAWLHSAVADKLGNGRVRCRFVGWLTFVGGSKLTRNAFFFGTGLRVFFYYCILVNAD
jgi:hypothetical protein